MLYTLQQTRGVLTELAPKFQIPIFGENVGELKPEKKRSSDKVFLQKKEKLPGNPLGNLVGLGIVAPTLHLDCKQPSFEVAAKEASDRFNVMGKKHPAEGGPQL